jgi:hypothetical protein
MTFLKPPVPQLDHLKILSLAFSHHPQKPSSSHVPISGSSRGIALETTLSIFKKKGADIQISEFTTASYGVRSYMHFNSVGSLQILS